MSCTVRQLKKDNKLVSHDAISTNNFHYIACPNMNWTHWCVTYLWCILTQRLSVVCSIIPCFTQRNGNNMNQLLVKLLFQKELLSVLIQYVQTQWSVPSDINLYILAVHVSTERVVTTLQHCLMLYVCFSHVSLNEHSPKRQHKWIPLWFWFCLPVPANTWASTAQRDHFKPRPKGQRSTQLPCVLNLHEWPTS